MAVSIDDLIISTARKFLPNLVEQAKAKCGGPWTGNESEDEIWDIVDSVMKEVRRESRS